MVSVISDKEKDNREVAYCPARILFGSKVINCQVINMTTNSARLLLSESSEFDSPFVLELGPLGSLLAETSPGQATRVDATFLDRPARVEKILQAVTEKYPDTDQRRNYPRAAVIYTAKAFSGSDMADCRIRDISEAGTCIRFDDQPSLNRIFRLKIRRFGEFRCCKIWQKAETIGVTFLEAPHKFIEYAQGPAFRVA